MINKIIARCRVTRLATCYAETIWAKASDADLTEEGKATRERVRQYWAAR